MTQTSRISAPLASIWIRLLAYTYEWLLVLAILFVAAAIPTLIYSGPIPPGTLWFDAYLAASVIAYFVYCYTRGGQTVSMKAWRLFLTDENGNLVQWRRALTRFGLNLLLIGGVIGLPWMWFDRDGLALQDRLTGTRMLRLPPG